jgi:hypothetical protein
MGFRIWQLEPSPFAIVSRRGVVPVCLGEFVNPFLEYSRGAAFSVPWECSGHLGQATGNAQFRIGQVEIALRRRIGTVGTADDPERDLRQGCFRYAGAFDRRHFRLAPQGENSRQGRPCPSVSAWVDWWGLECHSSWLRVQA